MSKRITPDSTIFDPIPLNKRPAYKMYVRHAEFAPWLLGWCRWEVVFEVRGMGGVGGPPDGMTLREVKAQGSWRWRGRRAHYREDVYEVNGVGELSCDDHWVPYDGTLRVAFSGFGKSDGTYPSGSWEELCAMSKLVVEHPAFRLPKSVDPHNPPHLRS